MKIDVVSVGTYQKELRFSVPATKVKNELDQAFNSLKRQVRLKGFRPGKAPRQVLEARFGPQVRSDVASNLIQQGYTDALTQHAIEPVGRPRVDRGDLEPSNDFEFTITVEVRPEVEIETYKDVEVVFPKVDVSSDEVDERVRARLESQARLVEVSDRAVEKGDMVLVELTAKDGDDVVATEPGTMIRTEADPYYPGVDDLLVGLNAGEEKTGTLSFPEDARTEAIAGRELEVTVKVLSIQANEVPELTDELAEESGYEGGAAGMRAAIESEIRTQRESMARNQARANLLQVLIEANPFDVPSGMVDQQLQLLLDELRLQWAYRGRDPRTVRFSEEQLADLRMRAEFAVKGGLILEYVSGHEDLAVTDDDLERKYQELADERGQTVEAIKGYFVKDDAVEELRARLLEEKTLDWLLEHAKLIAPEDKPEGSAQSETPTAVEDHGGTADVSSVAPSDEPTYLALLENPIGKLKEALATGEHDANLEALLAAEEAGKGRAGALSAIKSRMKQA